MSNDDANENLPPITGTPGTHPAAAGIGAVSGGLAGAAVGSPAGPIGMAVGATIGAVAGGLLGNAAAESANPTAVAIDDSASAAVGGPVDGSAEEAYWRSQFNREPYYAEPNTYDDYAPAYLTGYLGHGRLGGSAYEEIESELERDYSANRGASALSWEEARPAVRAAWTRVQNAGPVTRQ